MPVAARARNCEFLNKLDLTVNFVDLDTFEESVTHLASLHALRELFLMGNPCTEWEQHRAYVHRRPAQRCARAHAAVAVRVLIRVLLPVPPSQVCGGAMPADHDD